MMVSCAAAGVSSIIIARLSACASGIACAAEEISSAVSLVSAKDFMSSRFGCRQRLGNGWNVEQNSLP